MTRLDGYWSKFPEYWHIKNGVVVIHDDAPKEVKESYERYLKQAELKKEADLKQAEAARKRGTL